jgi:hypothetical protein
MTRPASLAAQVGATVTVEGIAVNAAAGAVVMTDEGPVYIAGLEAWDDTTRGSEVRYRGVLRVRDGGDQITVLGEPTHGIPSEHYVIESGSRVD